MKTFFSPEQGVTEMNNPPDFSKSFILLTTFFFLLQNEEH
jgi:hypothetical protein